MKERSAVGFFQIQILCTMRRRQAEDQGTWTHEELSARVVLAKSLNVGDIIQLKGGVIAQLGPVKVKSIKSQFRGEAGEQPDEDILIYLGKSFPSQNLEPGAYIYARKQHFAVVARAQQLKRQPLFVSTSTASAVLEMPTIKDAETLPKATAAADRIMTG